MIVLLFFIFLCEIYTSGTGISQSPLTLIQAKFGDTVTMNCSYSKDKTKGTLYWYKQGFGQIPRFVGQVTPYSGVKFDSEFNSERFRIMNTTNSFHLTINQAEPSDEAMYFCGFEKASEIAFGNGTFLKIQENLQSSSLVSVVQAPVPDPVYPGDSVKLMCKVITHTMTRDLRVFWISNASEVDHHPSIYVLKESTNQCEITSKNTCTYELLKSNVAPDDAGMHYCAVSTCGRIILGNGTKLRIESKLHYLVLGLGIALLVCLLVIFTLVIHQRAGPHSCIKGGCLVKQNNSLPAASGHQAGDSGELTYTTLNFPNTMGKTGRKKRSPPQDIVYSGVNLS